MEIEADVESGFSPAWMAEEVKRIKTHTQKENQKVEALYETLSIMNQARVYDIVELRNEDERMYHIVRTIFLQCGDSMNEVKPTELETQCRQIAMECSRVWMRVNEVRPTQATMDDIQESIAFGQLYTRPYHVLQVLYSMKTPHGLNIPCNEDHLVYIQMIRPNAFVQKHLPMEKTLKQRAQTHVTRECSLSNKTREGVALLLPTAMAMAMPPPSTEVMFAIDNTRFTKVRGLLYSLCNTWVRRYGGTMLSDKI
jgi:hypothetical protein